MSYNDKNKIRIFAEEATELSQDNLGLVYSDDAWKENTGMIRSRGAITGIASSQEYNTALRQSSLLATILAEIIAERYDVEVTNDFTEVEGNFQTYESYITNLASKFTKENFLFVDEVCTDHIKDYNITTSKIADGNVTKAKLNEDILNGYFPKMRVGTSDKLVFTETAPTSSPESGTLIVAVLTSEPSVKYDGVLYIII